MKGLLKYLDMHGYSGVEQKKAIIKLILLSEEISKVKFLEDEDRNELSKYLPNELDPGIVGYKLVEENLHPQKEQCMLRFDRQNDEDVIRIKQAHSVGFFVRDNKEIAKAKLYLETAWGLLNLHTEDISFISMLNLMSAVSMQGEYRDYQTKIYEQDIQHYEKTGDRVALVKEFLTQLEQDLHLNSPRVIEKEIEKVVYKPDHSWTPLQVVGALSLSALSLFAIGAAAKYASDNDYLPEARLPDFVGRWSGK